MEANRTQRSQTLMRLVTGYQVAQVIFVATKLDIPDRLSSGAKSSAALADETGTHAPSLCRLLRALAALDIVHEPEPDQFALTSLGRGLCADEPGSMRPLVLMHGNENFWQTWGELLYCVRSGQTAISHLFGTSNVFDFYAQHPEVESVVSAGFTAVAESFAAAVVEAYDFSGFRTVLDVGGGRGQLLAALLGGCPGTTGVLFDLPQVVKAAAALLQNAGVADRCRIVEGNMFASVPAGGDAYILSRVIHDWDDPRAITILAACRAAMPDQAKLLLIEGVLPSRADPSPTNRDRFLSDVNMLVRTGGRERTVEEYRELMDAAGLHFTRIIPTASAMSIVEGIKD